MRRRPGGSRRAGSGVAALTVVAGAVLACPRGLLAQQQRPAPKPVVTVVSGDPTHTGPFVLRVTYPVGFHNDPHRHNIDLTGTVLRGTLMMGQGVRFDTTRVVVVDSGRASVVKAGRAHFDWWPRGGELEIRGVGPLETVPADSAEAPGTTR
jgi:hypothetical protein